MFAGLKIVTALIVQSKESTKQNRQAKFGIYGNNQLEVETACMRLTQEGTN